jgi:hypothetical protein
MDKTIISVFIVVVILVLGWYFLFNNNSGNSVKEETIEGTILKVDMTQTKTDGPAIVTVQTTTGDERMVEVRTEGLLICPSYRDIYDAFWLNVGEKIQARGEVNSEGVIVPCASPTHYFKVTSAIEL